jgi:hypothetical protein
MGSFINLNSAVVDSYMKYFHLYDKVPPDAGASAGSSCGYPIGVGRQEGEIKQDLRYHGMAVDNGGLGKMSKDRSLDEDDSESAMSAARGILSLATCVSKDDSGKFLYTDGQRVCF